MGWVGLPFRKVAMAPRSDFSDWWVKDSRKGTPVVVTMENPNYSVLQIDGPDDEQESFRSMDKDRGKNAKQFTWVLLLKAHRAVGCVAWVAAALWTLLGVIKRRLVSRQGAEAQSDKPRKARLLLKLLRMFLALSLIAFTFELVAYRNGWHFPKPNLHLPENLHMPKKIEVQGWLHLAYLSWLSFRADYIAYPIQILSYICIILFIIQSTDRMILCLGCFWIKLNKIKPRIDEDPFKSGDGPEYQYPMVLVQIPMCNEREVMSQIPVFSSISMRCLQLMFLSFWICQVYEQSISAVCQIDWPKDRLLVQVLDDSDDESIQFLIRAEVSKWSQRGVNIVYRHRMVRTGYKAGNLKSAMSCHYVRNYEFVAIFDADFQPDPDFLKLTIPHFKVNTSSSS